MGRSHLLTKILLIKNPVHARGQVAKVSHLGPTAAKSLPCSGRLVGAAAYPLTSRCDGNMIVGQIGMLFELSRFAVTK